MVDGLATAVFWTLVALITGQAVLALRFILALRRRPPALPPDSACPRAAVVLCLRGADPFLPRGLRALLAQDYPDYSVHVVVDHQDDPAHAVVQEVRAATGSPRLHVAVLEERLETCSLKNSSLVQAIGGLERAVELVAMVDADTLVHPTWLREMVAPFADPRVGASTGNRWYMPEHASWGALTRHQWNVCACIMMYWLSIAWGGSLAVRASVLRDSGILARWRTSLFDDTLIPRVLQEGRWKLAFVPSAMIINREDCNLKGFFAFGRRQLLSARLHHPGWPGVLALAPVIAVPTVVAPAVLVAALGWGSPAAAAWVGAGLVAYVASFVLLHAPMELAMRRIGRGRGDAVSWLSPVVYARFLLAVPLTMAVFAAMIVSAQRAYRVDWRGITYQLDKAFRVRMVHYEPYRPTAAPGRTNASI